jgi:hypothetical protein
MVYLRHHNLLKYGTDLSQMDTSRKLRIRHFWQCPSVLLIPSQKIVFFKQERLTLIDSAASSGCQVNVRALASG